MARANSVAGCWRAALRLGPVRFGLQRNASCASSGGASPPSCGNARADAAQGDVGQDIGQHHQTARTEQDARSRRISAVQDGIVGQPAKCVPVEHGLHQRAAWQHQADLQPDCGGNQDTPIVPCVAEDFRARTGPWRGRCACCRPPSHQASRRASAANDAPCRSRRTRPEAASDDALHQEHGRMPRMIRTHPPHPAGGAVAKPRWTG